MNGIVAEKVHRVLGDRSPGEDVLVSSGWLEKDRGKLIVAWKVPKTDGHRTGICKAVLVRSPKHLYQRDERKQTAYGEEVMSIPDKVPANLGAIEESG